MEEHRGDSVLDFDGPWYSRSILWLACQFSNVFPSAILIPETVIAGQPQSFVRSMYLTPEFSKSTSQVVMKLCGWVSYVKIAPHPSRLSQENSEFGKIQFSHVAMASIYLQLSWQRQKQFLPGGNLQTRVQPP